MKNINYEIIKTFRECSNLQNSISNQESYDDFREIIDNAFDRIEILFSQDNETSQTKQICLDFLDNWVDEVNHGFANFYGINKEDWPVYANIIADDLELKGIITDQRILNLFIFSIAPQQEFFFKNDKTFSVILLLALLAMVSSVGRSCLNADKCLDSGSRWNDSMDKCEVNEK